MNAEISDLHESSVAVAAKVTVTQTPVLARKLASSARCVTLLLVGAQSRHFLSLIAVALFK
jgi:hypothetical protein